MPKKFMRSFKYARAGVEHIMRTQRNIWIHFFAGLAVLLAAFWLRISPAETAIIVLTIAFVIVTEMINTAVEEIVNLVKPEPHPLAGLVKNIAAGAVLVASAGAVVIGILIFIPRVI